jgi:uncharacterized membrane protein YraQ (UPF0718 family)
MVRVPVGNAVIGVDKLGTMWAVFQGLMIEALPFLVIGVVIASLARWIPPERRSLLAADLQELFVSRYANTPDSG